MQYYLNDEAIFLSLVNIVHNLWLSQHRAKKNYQDQKFWPFCMNWQSMPDMYLQILCGEQIWQIKPIVYKSWIYNLKNILYQTMHSKYVKIILHLYYSVDEIY